MIMPPTAVKRPFNQTQSSDIVSEPIQGTAIVVIHPGSQYLRIGRASDTFPQTVPHCIARRHKSSGQKNYEDPLVLRRERQHADIKSQEKIGIRQAEDAIKLRPTIDGSPRIPTSFKQLASHNSSVQAIQSDVLSQVKWTATEYKPEYLVGEEALYVKPSDQYDLHWPLRRGCFNIHEGHNGTPTSVIQDMEHIWGHVISNLLDIPLKDLRHYRAVLLIPDIYNRDDVSKLMTLLLERLGFGAAIFHQESVCAIFGAGVPSACVVDVGAQKTSVCCVDDGLSQRNSRVTMEYGGCDIDWAFHRLLQMSAFPYKECRLGNRLDALMMQELKESHCHMDQNTQGVLDATIHVKQPSKKITKYSVKFGDERILAPMGLFYPDMFGIQGKNLKRVHQRNQGQSSDPLDENYLIQTQSKQEQSAKLVAARKKAEQANQNVSETPGELEDSRLDAMDEDSNEATDSQDISIAGNKTLAEENEKDDTSALLGLDDAILWSIDRCSSDEMKKKMYSCIVVVGGGLNFEGSQAWLQYRIWTKMPAHYRIQLETMDVITKAKDMEPQLTCWKGATIMCCCDTAHELWIKRREWEKDGVKVLRERTPFVW
ncbi:unnamed protein product [Owenia fusiformis]|uniref:Actin-related protein 8 n=1 Tax=Owenia fusiformis TaxID=6347 RepID=A0A8S4PX40_OWEFU|nr:unnamed protein product [Owenia fusiformis]